MDCPFLGRPILKLIHLAQAFNLRMEVHGGGPHNMHVLCTMDNGWFYEWGLLHPMVERYLPFPWQKTLYDPIDADGCVQVPERPGLGDDIDFDYVREHTIGEGASSAGAPEVY